MKLIPNGDIMFNRKITYQLKVNLSSIVFILFLLSLCHTKDAFAARDPQQILAWADKHFAWAKEDWIASDKPFINIRKEINLKISKGLSPDTILQDAKNDSRKKPTDALAVFHWAYAAEVAGEKQVSAEEKEKRWAGVYEAFEVPKSPQSYEYDRLRYLMITRIDLWNAMPPIYNLGKRLVRRTPNDWLVKGDVANILCRYGREEDRKIGLIYAQQTSDANPKVPLNWAILGYAYFKNGDFKGHRDYFEQAIKAYQKYLEISSPKDNWRPNAKMYIQRCQKMLAESQVTDNTH